MPKQSHAEAKIRGIAAVRIVPLGEPIDAVRERANWATAFVVLMSARQTCEMNQAQLDAAVEKMIEAGMMPDDILQPFGEEISFLEAAIEILRSARARMCVGMARAVA